MNLRTDILNTNLGDSMAAKEKTFGQKMKEFRVKAGLSQPEMARRMDIKMSRLCGWEYENKIPDEIIQNHYLRLASKVSSRAIAFQERELQRSKKRA